MENGQDKKDVREKLPKLALLLLSTAIIIFAGVLSFLGLNVLFGAIILCALGFIYKKKGAEWLIYILTFYMPFEPFILKFVSDTIYPYLKYCPEVIIFILFISVLYKYFYQKGGKYIRTPIDIPLIVFVIITGLSALVNLENPLFWILGLRQILRYALLYYIIIYSRVSRQMSKKLILLLLMILIFQSAIGFGQAVVGEKAYDFFLPGEKREFANIVPPDYVKQFWSSGQRVFATMGRYDRLGTFMCLVMLLALGLFFETKFIKYRKILAAIIFLCIPTLILTYSRMSWIGFLLGLAVMGAAIRRNKKLVFAVILTGILIIGYLFSYIRTQHLRLYMVKDKPSVTITERFLSLFSPSELEQSYQEYGRLYFIVNTPLKVVANYPFFGVGLGQYGSGITAPLNNKEKYDKIGIPFGVGGVEGSIDNNWFSLWGETGTLGLLAYASIVISLLVHSLKIYKESDDWYARGLALGFIGIIFAVSFQSFLGPYFEVRILSYNFWLMAGIIVAVGEGEKRI